MIVFIYMNEQKQRMIDRAKGAVIPLALTGALIASAVIKPSADQDRACDPQRSEQVIPPNMKDGCETPEPPQEAPGPNPPPAIQYFSETTGKPQGPPIELPPASPQGS